MQEGLRLAWLCVEVKPNARALNANSMSQHNVPQDSYLFSTVKLAGKASAVTGRPAHQDEQQPEDIETD